MIKHKKLIICILLSYALFIVGIFNVRAEEFIRTQNVTYTNDTQIDLKLNGGTQYKGIKFSNTFNTGDANIIIIPASLYIQYYDPATSSSGILNGLTGQEFLSFQFYVNGYLCQLQSNGFKCVVPKNTNIQGEISIWFVNNYNASWQFNLIGKVDNNWQLYKDTSSSASEIANNTGDINNKISDSSIDNNNTSSSTTSWGNKNASNGTITNLLTLPISLLQAIVNGIQSSCTSFNLGSLFGTNIVLPCINIGSLIGSALWSTIDILFSGFMILAIAKKLIKIFNDFTNLKTNQVDELYGGGK